MQPFFKFYLIQYQPTIPHPRLLLRNGFTDPVQILWVPILDGQWDHLTNFVRMVGSNILCKLVHLRCSCLYHEQDLTVLIDFAFPFVYRRHLWYNVNTGCQFIFHQTMANSSAHLHVGHCHKCCWVFIVICSLASIMFSLTSITNNIAGFCNNLS